MDSVNLYRRIVWWYLATPVLLFCLLWYDHIIGFPLFYGLLFAVDYASRCSDVKAAPDFEYRFNAFLKILTIALTALVVWGTLAANYYDWQIHRAKLYDLARCHWPIGYDYQDVTYLFSYYLMFFIPPAAVAAITGLEWLPGAVELWTGLGYGLVFWGYFGRSKNIAEWMFLLFLLMSFSGWDILGYYWRVGEWPPFPAHLTNWNQTETTGNIFVFYWSPQHIIPAWLSGILLFRPGLRPENRVRFSILLLALVSYWSPLVAIGLVAFVLADLCSVNALKTILHNKHIYALSLCLAIPYYLYLSRDLSSVSHGWAIGDWKGFVAYYLQFIAFSFAVIMAIVLLLAGRRLNRRYLLASIITVLLSPLYHFGTYNDLTMRAPMVEYYFLLASAGDGALNLLRHYKTRKYYRARLAFSVFALLISLFAPVYDTIPVIQAIAGKGALPPFDAGLQSLLTEKRLRNENIVEITPAKKALLRPIETCPE